MATTHIDDAMIALMNRVKQEPDTTPLLACDLGEGTHFACDHMIRIEQQQRAALETIITVLARVPPTEPLEPGQVAFLLEKAREGLG